MTSKIPITFFAPAERKPIEVIQRQAAKLSETPLAGVFLNATFNYLLVLNAQRQIVMASENFLDLVGAKTIDQIIGLRPGEALACIHSNESESGCGTSRFCSKCNVVKVILAGLNGSREMEECHVTRCGPEGEETLHLRALATPLLHNKEQYTLLAMVKM